MKFKIMPIGDSITRGSYLALYETGRFAGSGIGLPNPAGGGWRKLLQDKLRAADVDFEFVGELDYDAYGRDGVVDPAFSPRHCGMAGFGNRAILKGGVVPTPPDVLAANGVTEIRVPDIVTVLAKHNPNVILLMSGTNDCDPEARDHLIGTILEHFEGTLLVATILPQCPPRTRYERVDVYNASLAGSVAEWSASGKRVILVDMNSALSVTTDLLPDGVHPNREGMDKMAAVWWSALQPIVQHAKIQK